MLTPCKNGYKLADIRDITQNLAPSCTFADLEVSALVTASATGDLQAGHSGAQMH